VLSDPLTLGGRLEENAGSGPVAEYRRESLAAGDDSSFSYRPILGENAQLTLAFVPIKSYLSIVGWPPG